MAAALTLTSPRTSTVDRLRANDLSIGLQVLAVVTFAFLTALGAQIRIYLWEVPFTLQTLAVYGSGLFLGWRNGLLSQVLYLLLGLFFPVFAGDGHGLVYMMGAASAGYLFAFPLVAATVGRLSERWNSMAGSTISMLFGSLVVFSIGVTWLHMAAGHGTWFESIDKGWLRFIPADIAKILCVAITYSGARRLARNGDEAA